jgi:D-inositol-3-phosphate glycosyltransferase
MEQSSSAGRRGPLRVLFVHHRSELGGAPTSLSYLIRGLGPEFEPHIYCPPGPAAELFRSAGATVHAGPVASFTHIWASVYKGRRWLLFARELALLPAHVVSFRRTLHRHAFDVVHLNDSPLVAAAWMARQEGVPIVWHLRSSLPYEGRDLRSGFVRRAIRLLATSSIAITEDVAAVFDVDARVVPNSVDLEHFRPGDRIESRMALGINPDELIVSYFGFIYPSKGFREFIQAAAQLRDAGIDARYMVVGGAVRGEAFFRTLIGRSLQLADLTRNYEAEAKQLVSELDLADVVHFVPFTQDTARIYQASDVVVAPSRGPELGRPVIEAAASGVPVIATGSRTGGGVIKPGETGLLVHDDSVSKLADAVREVLADTEQREWLGRNARAHAEQMFDPERNARQVEQIYHSLVPARTDARIPILYVHHRPQLGGAPSSLAQLIRELDPRFEPHVYCPGGPAAELFASVGAIVHEGEVSIFAHAWDSPYEGMRWLILGREAATLPPHLRQLNRLMREHRFPLVHLNDSPLLPAAYVAHRNGAKVIWHLRSALAGEGRDRRSAAIVSLMERWGDAAIAIDRDVAERFRLRLPLAIVHNSVRIPPDEKTEQRRKTALGLPADRVAVGFAGFVRRQKGWPELVEAAEILLSQGLPAHFAIMGGGVRPPAYFKTLRGRALAAANVLTDEESAIMELVASKGLTDSFSFLPFTADTGEIYSALDIVTFPNQGIGLGRPVLEAAMYGKPVVASGSRTGAGLLLPGKTGLLLDEPTPRNIAAALKQLIEDPELRARMGATAWDHARASFDSRRNAHAIAAVYDEVLGITPPSAPAAAEPLAAAV